MKRNMISKFLRNPFLSTTIEVTPIEFGFDSLTAGFNEGAFNGTKKRLAVIIQPASDDDLKILPEGSRYNPTVRIFSRERLLNGTCITHHGMRYRIISDSIWSDYDYYDSLATRYEGSQTDDSDGFVIR